MKTSLLVIGSFVATAFALPALAAASVKVTVEHATSTEEANTFPTITPASNADAGNLATYRLLEGRRDPNSAELEVLNDGQLPSRPDEPRSNFFLAGAGPSRLLIELLEPCSLQQMRTYSRHPTGRGPQRYSVYVRQSVQPEQPQQLERSPDAANSGWQLLAEVDTRSAGHSAATTAVAIKPTEPATTLGQHRCLLLVIEKGEPDDPFGNTFYSEIDLDDGRQHAPPPLPEGRSVLVIDDTYQIEFDTTATPKLTPWVERVLKPACAEWYPRIVDEFPTDGYQAPQQFKIVFEAGKDGVAYTMGTRVVCSEPWFANNLAGEAAGAVIHELVHVVQQFAGHPQRAPGWLVEGLADYIRWFQYEPPQNRPRVDFARAKHTDSYRTTGAFIDYLARSYDDKLPAQLNDLCRRGEYTDSAWKELTGKSVEELWREFAQSAQRPVAVRAERAASGNPVFDGWYADPEGVIFDNTYWIFPTYSAPYDEQLFFDAFSSPDLVTWTKHSRVLDAKSVKWANRAMWAPSVIEKDGKYFFFFGANDIQNNESPGGIGVAIADRSEGPYEDYLGKPLIDKFHNGAQPIDQFVFHDDDGLYYLIYGGWRHCNIARLNSDFTGFIPFDDGTTFREITPQGYVEGPFMFRRDGKYYFMWSEGGWTGPDYSVAYAIGDSPFGPWKRIGKVLEQDPQIATGAGHHSVIQVPGTDEYYAVYHRRPLGETDGNSRVTCIDRMEFDKDGHILPIKITNEGVAARRLE